MTETKTDVVIGIPERGGCNEGIISSIDMTLEIRWVGLDKTMQRKRSNLES